MVNDDPAILKRQVQRLVQVQTWMRWAWVVFLWLTLGSFCLWYLRADIALWLDYFTWSAVRVSLQRDRFVFLGLGLCVAMTLSTLVWQSWNIIFGIRKSEYKFLVKQVKDIQTQGSKHFLWHWVCEEEI